MIKLTVHPESDSITHFFSKPSIIIGSGETSEVDLRLPQEKLQNIHLIIIELENGFSIVNKANDPFVTLNGIPFGKKKLFTFDIIQIGKTLIRFDGEIDSQDSPNTEEGEDKAKENFSNFTDMVPLQSIEKPLEEIIHKKENIKGIEEKQLYHEYLPNVFFEEPMDKTNFGSEYKNANFAFPLNIETEIELEEGFEQIDIDSLVDEVEKLEFNNQQLAIQKDYENPNVNLEQNQNEEISTGIELPEIKSDKIIEKIDMEESLISRLPTIPIPINKRASIKEYYLNEFDDENENFHTDKETPKTAPISPTHKSLKFLIYTIAIIVTIILIVATGIYLAISDKSGEEEMKAAEGVADVAMALTYAQINQIKVNKQNWSDPDFIKNNLTAVLSNTYPSLSNIDAHGQFCNCPYILRIYTSGDLSKFLVIAQPAPSLLQWIIPKPAIIVDSKTMEMRKTKDIKFLNRLLVNASTLDGTNAIEISTFVKKGDLVKLVTFEKNNKDQNFSPPKALAMVRPGSENLIYNAPRYYHFGENLLNKAIQLNHSNSSHEVLILQQTMDALGQLPDMILYSSQGLQSAIEAQNALATFAPNKKFLIAYLKFNSKGHVIGSHLLIDSIAHSTEDQENSLAPPKQDIFTFSEMSQNKYFQNLAEIIPLKTETEIDVNHPLFMQLNAIAFSRQEALKPLAEELIGIIYKQTMEGVQEFSRKAEDLLKNFLEVSEEQRVKTSKALNKLHLEHLDLPMAQNMVYVHAAGLAAFVEQNLKLRYDAKDTWINIEEIEEQHKKIQNSRTWEELEKNVAATAEMLTLKRMPNADRLIDLQKNTRAQVITKLGQFLLSPEKHLEIRQFGTQQRIALVNILKSAWISEPNEQNYYLNEFDHLAK